MVDPARSIQPVTPVVRFALANWALLSAGLGALLLGLLRLYAGDATLAGAGLGAGLVLSLAATFERFESVKGLGIEAKARELDKRIDRADEVLATVRRLTEASSEALVRLAASAGRWDSAPRPEGNFAMVDELKRILEEAGTAKEKCDAILLPWARQLAIDIGIMVLGPYYERLSLGHAPMDSSKVHEARIYAGALLNSMRMNWDLDAFVEHLTAVPRDAPPFVPAAFLNELRVRTMRWVPELEHLVKHLDVADRSRFTTSLARYGARTGADQGTDGLD